MIPQNAIEETRLKSDIVDVISGYFPLKRAGQNFKALCPFHSEDTPSFVVSPEKQIFHCFGCGAGGNVFGFLMKYENMEFVEAVRKLAGQAGVKLPEKAGEDRSEREALYEAHQKIQQLFRAALEGPEGKRARTYLETRKLDSAVLEQFGIGYAPADGKRILQKLSGQGFGPALLAKAGLAVSSRSGEWLPKFRDRVTFPIFDVQGRIVGFGGRTLGEGVPKYLNSPETPIFSKGRVLYGLNFARRAVVEERSAIVTEGYLDVIRLYSAGIRNAVASLGTSFTGTQADLLKRYAEEALIALDADLAGQDATLRAMQIFLEKGMRIRVIPLSAGHDPDSFVRDEGLEAFRHLAAGAPSMLDYQLDLLCNRHGVEEEAGRTAVINGMSETILKISNQVEQDEAIIKLNKRIGVSEIALRKDLARGLRGQYLRKKPEGERLGKRCSMIEEKWLLGALLRKGELVPSVLREVSPDNFRDPLYKEIARWLSGLGEEELSQAVTLAGGFGDTAVQDALAEILMNVPIREGTEEQMAWDCVRKIQRYRKEMEKKELLQQLEKNEREGGDTEQLQRRVDEKVRKIHLLKEDHTAL